MIIVALLLLGLCLGSFINALVWRVHMQETKPKQAKKYLITRGRSMCPHCKHELAANDLLPVFSWLWLRGKCRYCKKPISAQYPAVELLTAALFVVSYALWPAPLRGQEAAYFGFWLVMLTGLLALAVYDFKWFLLPDRIMKPLAWLGFAQLIATTVILRHTSAVSPVSAFWGVVVGGGLFYVIFQVSKGEWIGGGDVKLGALLGLLIGGPLASMLMIFSASVLGTTIAIPLLLSGKAKRDTHLPFGPMLIIGAIFVQLAGKSLIHWYRTTLF